MLKVFFLVAIFIFGCISCGCISSQQSVMEANSSIISTNPTPVPVRTEIQSNPEPVSPTLLPEHASYEKGVSLYNQKKYQEAIDAFNITISLNATYGDAYLARGKAFYQIGRMKIYEVRGDEEFNEGINDFTKALIFGGNNSEILTYRGWSYYWKGINLYHRHRDGKYAKASFPLFELVVADFSQVIIDNQDNVDALVGRSLAYGWIGYGSDEPEHQRDSQKLDLAIKDAKWAYNRDPKNPWTNYALYQVANIEDQPPENLIKALDKAVLYDLGEAWYYYERGHAKESLKDEEGFLSDMKKAIELQPRFLYAYNGLAGYYSSQEKYDEALVTAQKSLEINPNIGITWNNFAVAQFNFLNPMTSTGLDECIKSMDRAIAMDPESALYHWNRYYYLAAANRWEETREEVKIFKRLAFSKQDIQQAEYMDEQSANGGYNPNLIRY